MNLRAPAAALVVLVLAACSVAPTTPPTAQLWGRGLAPTSGPTPTPATSWTGPNLIAQGVFRETDIAIDASGFVHIAAAGAGADNRGIWYITDASGNWTKERISTPPAVAGYEGLEYDGEPSIAAMGRSTSPSRAGRVMSARPTQAMPS